jgi:hypothetical protein
LQPPKGTVSLDRTKVKANTNMHKALTYRYAEPLESQLKKAVRKLMELAESSDENKTPDGMNIPSELEPRETRLVAIAKSFRDPMQLRPSRVWPIWMRTKFSIFRQDWAFFAKNTHTYVW